MALPSSFTDHLTAEGYHPRSDRHSNALAHAIAADLYTHCPLLRNQAHEGDVVYDLNFNLQANVSWNVDLVIGAPPLGEQEEVERGIRQRSPSTIQVAIELKSVMTEHRKTVRNRARDLDAHHQHVHHYNPNTIAAGVLVVNASESFKSPLREAITLHKNVDTLISHCIQQVRGLEIRQSGLSTEIDAVCALIIDFANNEAPAEYFSRPPAPSIGDPLHYDAFIQRICSAYEQLWG